ncbi:hypothetical protein Clacol_004761 [Clathrus columnatus]|uniref:K Homology domain-containing protein n=1 Tax=Clathrus columnatus TaxID=1419009 RepID=A0AAV5ABD8_9AGAM|nr:hypothetical protein Clacol_004761 [Clathrus columnatus]
MSSKRKWDQQADSKEGDSPAKMPKSEESTGKSATEAAAAAAAIAAKIAAQFASGVGLGPNGEPLDATFVRDIEINDVRNRYMLTKGSTQQQIHDETGAYITTKGVWYPDKSKATEKDPPLYLHVAASTQEVLDRAVEKIHELIALDLGSLVDDKKDRRERRKWPEEKIPVGLETLRNFNVRAKVVGPAQHQGMFVKHIQQETGTRVQIKGIGSGFVDAETGRESDEPMHIHITGPDELQLARAKNLTEDLLEVVRVEHAKAKVLMQQQQLELHQAQMQYAYGAYAYNAPPPPSDAPPLPPGEVPPPPPSDGSQPPPPPPSGSAQTGDAYTAYWAAYGYDVNSAEFKKWQAEQQQHYAQYYATQNYLGQATDASVAVPPPAPAPGGPPPPLPPPPMDH